jgi:DNA-binding winged helix-turn-helix (wHTH) protein/TolB-like protein/Tfp pilus assembly protein PilF
LARILQIPAKGATKLTAQALYEFDKFRLDPAEQRLLCGGEQVPLTPKAFQILCALIQSKGRLLNKDELIKKVWPNSFVEEANLSVNISALRKALGDTPDGQKFIETVPKRGYRFVMPIHEIGNVSQSEIKLEDSPTAVPILASLPAAPTVPHGPTRVSLSGRFGIAGFAVLLVIVLGYVAFSMHRWQTTKRTDSTQLRSLAVLPFQNTNKDPNNDFLGFSLADAIIAKLGYVSALTVKPSSAIQKYRDQTIDIPKVAAELNVETLLTGTFVREGDSLRVNAELIDAKTQNILWRGTLNLKYDKLLGVQDTVSQQIIRGLKLNLTPSEAERMKPDAPVDPRAYEYYLRGIDSYAQANFVLAIKMLEASAEIDPNYALTWAHVGRAYTADASFGFGGRNRYDKAQAAFERAISLQPAQIEAKIYMANFLTDTGRVEQAVPLIRDALKANPNHAETHWELGYAYRFAGMLQESVEECERARDLDPGVKLNTSALNAYLYLGQYDKFLESIPKESNAAFNIFYRGFGEYYKNDDQSAAQDFDRAFELEPALLQAQIGKAFSYRIGHEESRGIEMLREAEKKIETRGVGDPEAAYKIAQAYAALGDKPSALRVLERSISKGFFAYPYLAADPLLGNLHAEPQFANLMRTAGQRHEAFKHNFF